MKVTDVQDIEQIWCCFSDAAFANLTDRCSVWLHNLLV